MHRGHEVLAATHITHGVFLCSDLHAFCTVCFQYEEDEEIGEDGEPRARAKKQKKRTTKKSIFDVSSPYLCGSLSLLLQGALFLSYRFLSYMFLSYMHKGDILWQGSSVLEVQAVVKPVH